MLVGLFLVYMAGALYTLLCLMVYWSIDWIKGRNGVRWYWPPFFLILAIAWPYFIYVMSKDKEQC